MSVSGLAQPEKRPRITRLHNQLAGTVLNYQRKPLASATDSGLGVIGIGTSSRSRHPGAPGIAGHEDAYMACLNEARSCCTFAQPPCACFFRLQSSTSSPLKGAL